VFTYWVMIAVVLLVLLARRKSLPNTVSPSPTQNTTSTSRNLLIPVVLANMPFGMGIDHKTWDGAFILAGSRSSCFLCWAGCCARNVRAVAAAGVIWVPAVMSTADRSLARH